MTSLKVGFYDYPHPASGKVFVAPYMHSEVTRGKGYEQVASGGLEEILLQAAWLRFQGALKIKLNLTKQGDEVELWSMLPGAPGTETPEKKFNPSDYKSMES